MRMLLLLLSLVLFSCGNQTPQEKISFLSGYWEIEKVTLKDGSIKEFTVSTNIDFIEIQDSIGKRKKVSPKLDGTFTTFNQNETFTIVLKDDVLILDYKTPYATWSETVLKANETMLLVENSDGKRYQYKRYIPLNLN